jgi:sirohydrochlorin cobaltochelatase
MRAGASTCRMPGNSVSCVVWHLAVSVKPPTMAKRSAAYRLGNEALARRMTIGPDFVTAALVLCAHGVRGGVGSAAAHADRIRALGWFAEVHACAHKGAPGLPETLAGVHAPTVYLAPFLMAEGYTLAAIRRKIEAAARPGQRLRICRPVGSHPRLADAIAARAMATAAAKAWRPADTALLLVGHGTERHPESDTTTRQHAAQIAVRGGFAEVAVAFLDQAPRVAEALAALSAPRVIAVGLFVDRGEHGEEDIPALLAPAGARAAYAGPIGPDPLVTELILDQMRQAAAVTVAA